MQQNLDHSDELSLDALLLRYLDDECTAEERTRIEQDPDLQARLADLSHLNQTIRQTLVPDTSPAPTPEELIQFVEQTLEPTRALTVGQAIQRDASLQAEVEQIRTMLADSPFAPEGTPQLLDTLLSGIYDIINLIRVVQPAGVRGEVLRFEGPSIAITLRQEQVPGADPTWTMRGLIEQEHQSEDAVVILRSQDNQYYRTFSTDEGLFRFSGLATGMYTLTLLFDEQQQEWRLPTFDLPLS
jgi:hypothetical protein